MGSFVDDAELDFIRTFSEDVGAEVEPRLPWFCGKRVLCNCDDDLGSGFYRLFSYNFQALGLARLTCLSHFSGTARRIVMEEPGHSLVTSLPGGGSFLTREGRAELAKADVVCSHPPRSLAADYLSLVLGEGKEMLVLAPLRTVFDDDVLAVVRSGELWLGRERPQRFLAPSGAVIVVGGMRWFTNMAPEMRPAPLELTESVASGVYPRYEGTDILDVPDVSRIPADWMGPMGVPLTFLDHWSPAQFRIVDAARVVPEGVRGEGDFTFAEGVFGSASGAVDRLLIERIR